MWVPRMSHSQPLGPFRQLKNKSHFWCLSECWRIMTLYAFPTVEKTISNSSRMTPRHTPLWNKNWYHCVEYIIVIYLIMTLKINFIKLNSITLLKNTSGLFYRALYRPNVRSIFCKNYTFGDVNTFDVFQLSCNLLGRPMKSQLPHVLFINFYFLNILRNNIDNHDLDYIYFQQLSRQTSL